MCIGNSARSQMAEALLRKFSGDQFNVFSAGLDATVINPMTIQVLNEIGIDASRQYVKPLSLFAGKHTFDYLITVCANAEERCPLFFGAGIRLHWPFNDPGTVCSSDLQKLEAFRKIRDQIKYKILSWLDELGISHAN